MSTKIYTAYRFPVGRINDFIEWFRETCFTQAIERMEGCMETVTQKGIDEFYQRHSTMLSVPELKKRISERQVRAYLAFKLLLTKVGGDRLLDLDCWFNLWLDEPYAYVQPCYPVSRAEKVKPPNWVDDYCYFDNTDIPEGIPVDEWEKRGAVWEKLCLEDHNRSRLSHVVIEADLKNFGMGTGLDELEKRLLKDEKGEACAFIMATLDMQEDQKKG